MSSFKAVDVTILADTDLADTDWSNLKFAL